MVKTFVCPSNKCAWKFITMDVDEHIHSITCSCGRTAWEEGEVEKEHATWKQS